MLAPTNFCETRRHHCVLGHLYEHHRPPEHYFLDQVSGKCTHMLTVRSLKHSEFEILDSEKKKKNFFKTSCKEKKEKKQNYLK